ncbi:MAG: hypothetical protein M1825_003053 [Sarcosagium campestre]|nr:MAG: hypothetical protein M1825_003053 [Sarcosagium campestre]
MGRPRKRKLSEDAPAKDRNASVSHLRTSVGFLSPESESTPHSPLSRTSTSSCMTNGTKAAREQARERCVYGDPAMLRVVNFHGFTHSLPTSQDHPGSTRAALPESSLPPLSTGTKAPLFDLPIPSAPVTMSGSIPTPDTSSSSSSSSPFSTQQQQHTFTSPHHMMTTRSPTPPSTETLGRCTCTSDLFLSITASTAMATQTPQPAFPLALTTLRNATKTACDALDCRFCRPPHPTVYQQMMSLATLLPLIAAGYAAVLRQVDEHAAELERRGQKKLVRMGDSPTADWDVEFEPAEWRELARRVVRGSIVGTGDTGASASTASSSAATAAADSPAPSLMSVVDKMEQRQKNHHANMNDRTRIDSGHGITGEESICLKIGTLAEKNGDEPFCRRVVGHVRERVQALKI